MSETTAERNGLLPIFDGHNDVLLAVYGGSRREAARSFFERGTSGHLDLPRAREGGFAGGFFAVYVTPDPAARRPALRPEPEPAVDPWTVLPPPVEQPFALRLAMSLTATLFRLEEGSYTFHDIHLQPRRGRVQLTNTATYIGGSLLPHAPEQPPAPWVTTDLPAEQPTSPCSTDVAKL